ncbi:PREDICTED: uncharacterized protein At4g38065-like [Camelina sativa]|uniref:Uncharacterized protein At4g38065-like n=1 Tax=Camelina sativa TaxID=90675 RepID=A0ABM0TD53_CAMSA|nr:PREDICTED: uncharacterized protein At4g38065-like [Camelina sativa]
MSSEEQNRTATEDEELIKNCKLLLYYGAYKEVRETIKKIQPVRSELPDELERASAIADILYAKENPLPDGSKDLYGMVRMTQPGPLLVKNFENLMHLLSSKHNRLPLCHQSSVEASAAWSELCSQTTKYGENIDQTQGNFFGDMDVGGIQIGDGDNLDQPQGFVLGHVDEGGSQNGGGQEKCPWRHGCRRQTNRWWGQP